MNLLSWVKGLFNIKRKKVTYIPLGKRIKLYNKKEHEEHRKSAKKLSPHTKKYAKYF